MLFLLLFILYPVQILGKEDKGCQFHEHGRRKTSKEIRISEDLPPGTEIFTVTAFPRSSFNIQAIDGSRADGYFSFREIDRRHVTVVLEKSLQNLVDQRKPMSQIKFRLACRGRDQSSEYLPVTVNIEDINDHTPEFHTSFYNVTIDEKTPPGLTIFRGIQATDRDKPNSPNSELTYSIISGNEDKKFSLEGHQKAVVVLRKPLDFEAGDKLFNLTIVAEDNGNPRLSATASLIVNIKDVDDMNPQFTQSIYTTEILENLPNTNNSINIHVDFSPPILAIDLDIGLNTSLKYFITSGNDLKYFQMDPNSGQLFQVKPIDREVLESDKFSIEVTVQQLDNELKSANTKLDIHVIDINDNKPEFPVAMYKMTVIENLPAGYFIMKFNAVDRDTGNNSVFSYRLQDPSGAFGLAPDGSLVLQHPELFDRETMESVTVRVEAVEVEPSVVEDPRPNYVLVELHLLDTNDNNPVFIPSNVYIFDVASRAAKGDVIGQVQASDPDQGENGIIRYSIKNATHNSPVSIDPRTGQIKLIQDLYKKKRISVFVEASDQPDKEEDRKFSLAVVELQFAESGSEAVFVSTPYEWWIKGDAGELVGAVRTENLDVNTIRYSLKHTYSEKVPFDVEPSTGILTVTGNPVLSWRPYYKIEVVAEDFGGSISSVATIHVDPASKDEAVSEPTRVYYVKENVEDAVVANLSSFLHKNQGFTEYMIANLEARENFVLNENGILKTRQALDRELQEQHMVTIVVGRRGVHRGKHVIQCKVIVEDSNDNLPYFKQHIYHGYIRENSVPGAEVVLAHNVIAADPDSSDSDGVSVQLYGKASHVFRLDASSGNVFLVSGGLDREQTDVYYLRLRATDQAGHTGEAQLVIRVTNINDHKPKFIKLQVLDTRIVSVSADKVWVGSGIGAPVLELMETVPPGTRIANVLAEDKDSNITYSLISEEAIYTRQRQGRQTVARNRFLVDLETGDIVVGKHVEPMTLYTLNISAEDEGGLSTVTQVILRVNDTNNNKPVFVKNFYKFKIIEGFYNEADVGSVLAEDYDFDDNGKVDYTIVDNHQPFQIDSTTGAITVSGSLDRESNDEYKFQVKAMDNGQNKLVGIVNVTVAVLDKNDNQPVFYGYDRLAEYGSATAGNINRPPHVVPIYLASVDEDVGAGVDVATVAANDTDDLVSGNGLVEFRINSHTDMFYIQPENGVVTTLKKLEGSGVGSFNISVEARDQGNPPHVATAIIHLQIRKNVPTPPPRKYNSSQIVTKVKQNQTLSTTTGPSKVLLKQDDIETAQEEQQSQFAQTGNFNRNIFSVDVYENIETPFLILNIGNYRAKRNKNHINYQVMGTNYDIFSITKSSGLLYLNARPDREEKDQYIVKIKAVSSGNKEDNNGQTWYDEENLQVIVNILDTNDNRPKFSDSGAIVASVPFDAEYGHRITSLKAVDVDSGVNSDLSFSIIENIGNGSGRFYVESDTGEVRSTASFAGDAGKVFIFGVAVTDAGGAVNGLTDTTQLKIYVLDDNHRMKLVINQPKVVVMNTLTNIVETLSQMTGLVIQVSTVAQNDENHSFTDLVFYGIKSNTGDLVLSREMVYPISSQLTEVQRQLGDVQIVEMIKPYDDRSLGSVEVAVLTMACLIFLGALIAVLSICCIKIKRTRKLYPAPLAIPLPHYKYDPDKKEPSRTLERQKSGQFLRPIKITDKKVDQEFGEKSFYLDSCEEMSDNCRDRSRSHKRQEDGCSQRSSSTHRKSTRSTRSLGTAGGVKSSGESTRSRDSGIDENRDCCSYRRSSISSRESYVEPAKQCVRCCPGNRNPLRRHRSSSPLGPLTNCSLRSRRFLPLPRYSHSQHDLGRPRGHNEPRSYSGPRPEARSYSHHDLRDTESEDEDEVKQFAPRRSSSSRRPLYTDELFTDSLEPSSHGPELRIASTTASKGHSWRGDHPIKSVQQAGEGFAAISSRSNSYRDFNDAVTDQNQQRSKLNHANKDIDHNKSKPTLKTPSGGVKLLGLSQDLD